MRWTKLGWKSKKAGIVHLLFFFPFHNEGISPRWWSSGQRSCLLLRWSQFGSCCLLTFSVQKDEKRGRVKKGISPRDAQLKILFVISYNNNSMFRLIWSSRATRVIASAGDTLNKSQQTHPIATKVIFHAATNQNDFLRIFFSFWWQSFFCTTEWMGASCSKQENIFH